MGSSAVTRKRAVVVATGVSGALALSVLAAPAPAACAPALSSCTIVGQPRPQGHGVFRFPQAIGFSPGGRQVFVGDQHSSVIQKFSISPQDSGPDVATWQWDIGGHADRRQNGRLGVVGGVATDRSGHVYVLDSQNDRVQVFSSESGAWLGAFGEHGTGEGQFDLGKSTGAGGVAVWQLPSTTSPNGNPVRLFLADQRNDRIQRFTLDPGTGLPEPLAGTATTHGGKVVSRPDADWSLGTFGDCHATGDCASTAHDYHLNYPQGVAVNPADWTGTGAGRIYIADDRNHRVLIWRDGGDGAPPVYAGQIGAYGTAQGQFRFPYDVGVDWHTPNYLYVADNNNHRVQQFDAGSYGFVRMWGSFGREDGEFGYPRALAALDENPEGGVYVADTASNRVQGFDVGGNKTVEPFGIAGRGPGYMTRPWGAAVDPGGNIYIADTFDHRIQKLAPDGTYLAQWGYISERSGFAAPNTGNGQFQNPRGVAYDPARDHIWVADATNHRVQEFTTDGEWLATHAGFQFPYGIAVDPSGQVYVTDTGGDRIRGWDGASWTTVGTDPGFVSPRGVASAGDGVLYVADLGGGVWRYSGGTWSSVSGAPIDPGGVWVDRARRLLYVSDQGDDRIMRLELGESGATWDSWGTNGEELGDLIDPAGLTTDADGALLIADAYNNRIQRWRSSVAAPASLSMEATPSVATAAAGGTGANYVVSFTSSNFSGSIDLAVTGCPRRVSCALQPDPLDYTGTETSTLTAEATKNADAGVLELTITATAPGVSVAPVKVTLNVTATTDNAGRSAPTDRPAVHTVLGALSATTPPRLSADRVVRMRMLVGSRVSDSTPSRGALVRFSGIVKPAHHGRLAYIQKLATTGRWVTVARTTLRALNATASRYNRRIRVRRSGSYRVRVLGHGDHAMGISRVRTLTVR